MKGPIVFGKGRIAGIDALRSIRNFTIEKKVQKQPEPARPPDMPIPVNPSVDKAEPELPQDDDESDEDGTLPGDNLRMQYQMHGGGWIPKNPTQTPPPETVNMGISVASLINRDVVQKIAESLKIKIPFKLAQQILDRHLHMYKPTIRVMQRAAKDLLVIFDRETRTVVPPNYRHRLAQILARAMFTYVASKGTELTGSGSRLRKKLDPNAYHPHAKAFVRALTIAMKPALSIGATAMSYSPSVAAQILSPVVQAAANTL